MNRQDIGRMARWYEENKLTLEKRAKVFTKEVKAVEKAGRKKRYEENREIFRAYYHNRRAAKRAAEGTHTAADIAQLLQSQKSRCAVCRIKLTPKIGHHVDHIMPLTKGGTNDRYNLQILCPSCNCSKNAKHPVQFMQERGFLL